MRSIDLFLQKYDDHQSLLTKLIRTIAIVAIQLGFLGLLWSLPDGPIKSWMGDRLFANWATVYSVLLIIYYGSESFSLTFGGGFFMIAGLFSTQQIFFKLNPYFPLITYSLLAGGIFLFILGRILSGNIKKLGNDLIFIPIQPVWILSYLYRWMGLSI